MAVIFLVLTIFMVALWLWLRDRLGEMDSRWAGLEQRVVAYGYRLDALEGRVGSAPAAAPIERPEVRPVATPAPVMRPPIVQMPPSPRRPMETPLRQAEAPALPRTAATPAPPQTAETTPPALPHTLDWEATLGGNWLNKAGVLLLVIGLALALGYSFAHIGPVGRVAISLTASFAMLVAGAVFEPRPRYKIFARGLLGGGWAALYTTVYAMHAIREARVIDNPIAGAALLIAVAAAMIVHSLKYRSETVTGLAYFIAFFTLAITQVNSLAVAAMIPLAASLLYLAHRFTWRKMALFGLIATYVTCALRGDTGAPLWEAQSVFATFWLLFEIFDVLHPETWLLPLNAAGFLGLSLLKWQHASPHTVWMLLAGTGAAYLVSALSRTRSGRWHGAATLAAALAAASIFQRLDHQWIASGLVVEAELVYLTGLRLRKPYLRWLGTALFVLELGRLAIFDVGTLPLAAWVPVASVDVVVFYANRVLCAADVYFGYAGAFVAALIAGEETTDQSRGMVWMLAGVAPFLIGWWRRLLDFRIQGYALALLGAAGIATVMPQPTLALGIAAAICYAATFAAARLPDEERDMLRVLASSATVIAICGLIWRVTPGGYLGIAWMAAALGLMELGLPQAQALAAVGAVRVFYFNAVPAHNYGPWIPRAIPAGTALLAYLDAWRARRVFMVASFAGTAFLAIALWTLLPAMMVGPAWALLAIALMQFDAPALRWQAHLVALASFLRMFYVNIDEPYRLPSMGTVLLSHYYLWWRSQLRAYLYTAAALVLTLMYYQMDHSLTAVAWAPFAVTLLYAGVRWSLADLRWQSYSIAAGTAAYCLWFNMVIGEHAVLAGGIVIACFFAGQLLAPRSGPARPIFAMLAIALTTILVFCQVSGSKLTVAWGIEGALLLAAGFALRDRLLRLPGLMLLLGCILKLFLWDLRHLDTLPRIFSFIGLGLILVGVSWVYSRFREQVSRLL